MKVAILLDLVREEMHRERILRTSLQKNEALEANSKTCQSTLFWSTSILELVESVLRPDFFRASNFGGNCWFSKMINELCLQSSSHLFLLLSSLVILPLGFFAFEFYSLEIS
ncbi:hypothetical protein J1N35_026799 [Gossypium stocksii]|uniref:Uncharacterized protein n=1 Tax=Gossypium stocksii TaxID=47602 RepID=A0A9D3V9W0_9ROSI|nr:hypothetical protein J1N35_026799 [Gossypium stocksii]